MSWYQDDARVSLELIEALGVGSSDAVVDVGGGASVFAEQLVARGFTDVWVVDVSAGALAAAQRRAGSDSPIQWCQRDLLDWRPERLFDVWHDRAVFHFLNRRTDCERYLATLHAAVPSGGAVLLGTFAPDGPDACSGLPVARYSASQLAGLLGPDFELVEALREEHITPAGVMQPFTWVAGRVHGA